MMLLGLVKRFVLFKLVLINILLSSFSSVISQGHSLSPSDLDDCQKEIVDTSGDFSEAFKDYLKQELAEVNILALGEATHEDGATFKHKVRLVKYLHEELGFNILAFEYAFYGNWMANSAFREGVDARSAVPYAGWIKSREALPVYKYIASTYQTPHPLIYAGYDGEKLPLGIPQTRQLIYEIANQTDNEITQKDSLVLDSLILAVEGKIGNPMINTLSYQSRNQAKGVVIDLLEFMNHNRKDLIRYWGDHRFLIYRLSLESFLMNEKATFAGTFKNLVRDKNMAERVRWLVDSIYPGEKIILWGASGHFARNMVQIDRTMEPESYGFYPYFQMGDWLNAWYGDDYYSIAFVAGSGKTGTQFPADHKYKKYEQFYEIGPKSGSFESAAFRSGANTLFCSLKEAESSSPLHAEFIAYPFGYQEDLAPWHNIVDAFFFIREMRPDELVE